MSESGSRLASLDLWRSVCIAAMCVYHLIYDLALFGLIPAGAPDSAACVVLRSLTGAGFILLAGVCCRFSGNNILRGLTVLAAGFLVIAASILVKNPVQFGILQLLGLCMMFYGLAGERLERLPKAVLPLICAVLFFLTLWWTNSVTVDITWIFSLGFVTEDFYSSDYYPLFPWAFLFLLGTWLGGFLKGKRGKLSLPRALTWPGRHSLIIYLVHQPVIYGVVYVISRWVV